MVELPSLASQVCKMVKRHRLTAVHAAHNKLRASPLPLPCIDNPLEKGPRIQDESCLICGYLARISRRRDACGSPRVRPEEVGGAPVADAQEAVASPVAGTRWSTMPLLPLDSGSFVLGDLLRSDGRTTDPVMEAPDLPDPSVWESACKEDRAGKPRSMSIPDAGEGRGEEQEREERRRGGREAHTDS